MKSLPQYTHTTSSLQSHSHTRTQSTHIPQSTHPQPASRPTGTVSHKAGPDNTEAASGPSGCQVPESHPDACTQVTHGNAWLPTHMLGHTDSELTSMSLCAHAHPRVWVHNTPMGLRSPRQTPRATHTDSPNVSRVSPATYPFPTLSPAPSSMPQLRLQTEPLIYLISKTPTPAPCPPQ